MAAVTLMTAMNLSAQEEEVVNASGHTLLGWSSALLMMEINPDRATEILTRGYRYGENRLVVGAHWQSDTDAARLAASAATGAYTLQGIPATPGTRGIIIENQQKRVWK